MTKVIEEGYLEAIELLKNNSSLYGILASGASERAKNRNYLSIFGRDASICALGMQASGNRELIKVAEKSLINLARLQAKNGQIPNYVKPETGQADFWYLGCIDSTLWWLIAIYHFGKANGRLERKLAKEINKAIGWLECQEHPLFYLLTQNEASDWADIMPRSGYVLYTNSLWYWVKRLYRLENADKTKESFNYVFYPWQKVPQGYLKSNHRAKHLIEHVRANESKKDYCLSFVNYEFYGTEVDVFGNLLAILSGALTQKEQTKLLAFLGEYLDGKTGCLPTCLNPVKKNSPMWRAYMGIHGQNYPGQYHNGGIWPFINGFYAIALSRDKASAMTVLGNIANLNKINKWQFNEWFHGKTGKPSGMARQSWNAATYILAYEHLKNNKII